MTCKHGWNWKQLETCPMCEEVNSAVAAEREACAKLAQEHFIFGHSIAGPHFAAALADKIRVRSNAELRPLPQAVAP